MADWKETLNLPRTEFPMKANLQTSEPQAIARWDSIDLYGQIRQRRKDAPKFVLHDGPPYANGRIHLGTSFNKIMKDFVVRTRSMAGFDAPYVPGWDCHGLPIELMVDRELGPRKQQMSIAEFRRTCRAYASRFVDVMRNAFKRLGVQGAWNEPYLTMEYGYQATNYAFWIGFAHGRGIDLKLRCWLDEFNQRIYGYEGETQIDRLYFQARFTENEDVYEKNKGTLGKVQQRMEEAMLANEFDKVAQLSLELETVAMVTGETFAGMNEAKRYAEREDMISRQEFERVAAQSQQEAEDLKSNMDHAGGKCEYVWNVWRQTGQIIALEQ